MATPICVLGMHRSGTSLTADMLVRLGVEFGSPKREMATAPREHAGYWENLDVVDINHAVLLAMGGASWAPPPMAPGWECSPMLDELAERAREVLADQVARAPLWGFKGPMTTLTLPFWWRVAGEFRHVVCVRSPSGCAASLAARDPDGPLGTAEWGAVWLHYHALSLQYLRGQPATWMFFEDWPGGAPEQVARLATALGDAAPARDELERVAEGFQPELLHHRADPAGAVADPGIPAEATALWTAMRWLLGPAQASQESQTALADLALRLWASVDPVSAEAWAPGARGARPAERPPRVSVVLPVRNPDPAELRATVAMAAAQDMHDLEIVVVDDGSRNGSVDGVTDVDWRVRVVRNRVPRGDRLARRSGRRAARGAVVVNLGLGERWERDRLRTLADSAGGM